MIEVRERFFMREVREMHPWAKVRADLEDGGLLARHEHYELAFSPYPDGYPYPFLVTTRDSTPGTRATARGTSACATGSSRSPRCFPSRRTSSTCCSTSRPSSRPLLLRGSVKSLVKDEYDEVSYKVFNIGTLNNLPAYSCEIGVPMDGRHIEAVETIFRVAAERRELGQVYQSSPIALRFVKASPAYLSMMNGRDTMMIELVGLNGNDGGIELLKAYEEALYALGGRPHWGHINTLSGGHGFVESMYPRHADWLDVRARLDPDGVFDSPFTKRVGLSSDQLRGVARRPRLARAVGRRAGTQRAWTFAPASASRLGPVEDEAVVADSHPPSRGIEAAFIVGIIADPRAGRSAEAAHAGRLVGVAAVEAIWSRHDAGAVDEQVSQREQEGLEGTSPRSTSARCVHDRLMRRQPSSQGCAQRPMRWPRPTARGRRHGVLRVIRGPRPRVPPGGVSERVDPRSVASARRSGSRPRGRRARPGGVKLSLTRLFRATDVGSFRRRRGSWRARCTPRTRPAGSPPGRARRRPELARRPGTWTSSLLTGMLGLQPSPRRRGRRLPGARGADAALPRARPLAAAARRARTA